MNELLIIIGYSVTGAVVAGVNNRIAPEVYLDGGAWIFTIMFWPFVLILDIVIGFGYGLYRLARWIGGVK